ncbi:ribonuclease T2 [Sphingomonas sp. 28-62-11]|uniref:ribonuclease T2 n=1 Tax=Sphingomonas sp. 28-62-11 TaxID=1970432 RepID=UPI0035A9A535
MPMSRLRRFAALIVAAAAVALPGLAHAQAYSCAVPDRVPVPRADGPSASQPKRVLPIGSYTLAITWTPQYCRSNARDESARFQCGSGNRFGFTLHGLWPDGTGETWPQYCKPAEILAPAVIRKNLCATPSPQLLQHEWAKHGTCMNTTPDGYFDKATGLFGRLRYPDMNVLSRRRLTAGQLATAMARANPGVQANMMRITATRQGWLDEIWLCMDKQLRFAACPAHQGGLAPGNPIKIWRGRR